MKTDKQHIEQIRKGFADMQSRKDLVKLLSLAKSLMYDVDTQPFKTKSINYYSNYKVASKRYKQFSVKKKSGGERLINAPVKGLKSIQRALNFILQCVCEHEKAATGFVQGRSIVDNARLHQGHRYVYNIDLKDFFPSIELHRVKACLKLKPFNLDGEREPLAFLIANLCCNPMEVERFKNGKWVKKVRPVLPQGAPTSPTITNIVARNLDRKLTGVARRFGLVYSRYADDITFSSFHNVFQENGDFLNELERIIRGEKFHLNPKKTRLQKEFYRQEVTGLVVNEKANVRRRYIKQIRMWLHYWERYGYEKAEEIFKKDYEEDKGHVKNGSPSLQNVLDGKLEFLKMVKGAQDSTYCKLSDRYFRLTDRSDEVAVVEPKEENQKKQETEVVQHKYHEESLYVPEGQIELTLRPIGADKSIKLLTAKYIPEGIEMPYKEFFENQPKVIYRSTKRHNPKKVVEWLKLFTEEGSNIKYSTHLWDEQNLFSNYDQFIKGLELEFVKYKFSELQNYSTNLYWEKIYPFLFQKNLTSIEKQKKKEFGWGKHDIKIGWQYPDTIKNWCKENFDDLGENGSLPFSMEIPEELLPDKPIAGKTVKYFEDVVDVFKREIEFRDNDLYIGIKLSCKNEIPNFNVDGQLLNTLKGCSFYTNTEYVLKAANRILKMVRSRPESQDVEIKCNFVEEEKVYIMEILHKNSFSDKDIHHPKIMLKEGSGDISIIRTTLMSLCDLSLESRFKDEDNQLVTAKIDYLYDGVEKHDWIPRVTILDSDAEGFKFILKFPAL